MPTYANSMLVANRCSERKRHDKTIATLGVHLVLT